jgi:predicted nuclease with TOPRIM domain
MADRIDDLTKRVETVETKLDRLSASVDQRFDQVERRFDQVDAAIVEQREYTEFAYSRLEAKMEAGFSRLEGKIDAESGRLDAKMDAGFGHVGRIERKLDQFIDVQLQANQLMDRRLRALEEQPLGPSEAG